MNLRVRTTKTSSNNTAIQIVHYGNRRVNVVKHIGTATNENEINIFKQQALIWIQENNTQLPLFKERQIDENKIFNDQYVLKNSEIYIQK